MKLLNYLRKYKKKQENAFKFKKKLHRYKKLKNSIKIRITRNHKSSSSYKNSIKTKNKKNIYKTSKKLRNSINCIKSSQPRNSRNWESSNNYRNLRSLKTWGTE